MKKVIEIALGTLLLGFALAQPSCSKEPDPTPSNTTAGTTAGTSAGTTSGTSKTGELRVTHRLYSSTGDKAANAECGIARTADSLDAGIYFQQGRTDGSGVYSYKNLPITGSYSIYAMLTVNGDTLRASKYNLTVEHNAVRGENLILVGGLDPNSKTGELNVSHRILTNAGQAATNADCAIAFTQDSMDSKLYFHTAKSDVNGTVIYRNLPKGINYALTAKKFHNGDTIRRTDYSIEVQEGKRLNRTMALE